MASNQEFTQYFPNNGRVVWIGVRPERKHSMQALQTADLIMDHGIKGDHRASTSGSNRQVTLIQHEDIAALQSFLQKSDIIPEMLRRNIVVSGINLVALIEKEFYIGNVTLIGSGHCHPCSRMEKTIGYGAYNAMCGYGGITATIQTSGTIAIGDEVRVKEMTKSQ